MSPRNREPWRDRNTDADEALGLALRLEADAKRLARDDLDPRERARLLARVRRAAHAFVGDDDAEAPVRARRRAMRTALDAAAASVQRGCELAGAVAVARAAMTLASYRLEAERASDDLWRDAISVWRRNVPKWRQLNRLARALRCHAVTADALRTELARIDP